MKMNQTTKRNNIAQADDEMGLFEILREIVQTDEFNYDKFDWGKLRYLLELRRFLEKWVKKSQTFGSIEAFFIRIRKFLEGVKELNKYNLVQYRAASMLTLFIFVKLCGFEKVKDALMFLNKNKRWGSIIFGDNIPSEGTISSFKKNWVMT